MGQSQARMPNLSPFLKISLPGYVALTKLNFFAIIIVIIVFFMCVFVYNYWVGCGIFCLSFTDHCIIFINITICIN